MQNEFLSLEQTDVFSILQKLALTPYDLTAPGALISNDRLAQYVCRSKTFDLHFATQRLDDQVLAALQKLSDELALVEQFKMMKQGVVMNRIIDFDSEERQVLHTACRDLFRAEVSEPKASGAARKELDKLQDFLFKVESGRLCNHLGEKFDTLIHIGIGGSDLGPRAVYEALRPFRIKGKKVCFISNVDPDDAAKVLSEVNLATCLVNVVSKSGTTLETLANEKFVKNALQQAGLDPTKHCIAVTGQGSPMDNPDSYLQSFYMFDYIGGRYSVTSMVGAVMLGFSIGIDQVKEFLKGASLVDIDAEETDISRNLPLLLALIGVWNHNFLHHPTLAILPYSQALHRFPAHLQQCDMESNGKSIDRYGKPVSYKTGPVIWGEPGTNGQHAFYQLLHQGTEIVPVEFIGFKNSQFAMDIQVEGTTSQEKLLANLLAQMLALASGQENKNPNKLFAGNRPSCLLFGERLTAKTIGALLAIYEAKIAFQGFVWNVNSFDQEGVQLGKVLAGKFLRAMTAGTRNANELESLILRQL